MDGQPYSFLDIQDKKRGFDSTIPLEPESFDPRAPEIAVRAQPTGPTNHNLTGRRAGEHNGIGYRPVERVDYAARPRAKAMPNASMKTELNRLSAAPVKENVEYSRFGALPKVANNGRRPSDAYARPAPDLGGPGTQQQPARIAILINGLGLSYMETKTAIENLPGEISLAFGPYGRNLQGWVRKAREHGHEVLLEIPLEPYDYPDIDPGPHTLLSNIHPTENIYRLKWMMGRFTGYMGITNTNGERFMTSAKGMAPVWQEIRNRGLAFFDTSNATQSVADKVADEIGLEYGASEVTIDAEQTPEDIDAALQKLENLALERGLAIGVASGLPLTVKRLEKWSKELANKGIMLVPLSAAIKARYRT